MRLEKDADIWISLLECMLVRMEVQENKDDR